MLSGLPPIATDARTSSIGSVVPKPDMTAGTCRISLIVVRPWAKVQEPLELLPALTNVVMASSDQVGQVGRF